ncbi:hypothetical protein [Gilvimarinus xylanilyticus]|uniref:Uncharacterized protein n=1 Tax=Gilvimarinus xylanilyticus TaxID=2944139 RepID=A0A9X2I5P4_9GAMM|nr:hypothetical protein [Gilvimarinus xylanilyticus]MCP8899917.1 hypothetical protein [Gilvimarinus xylanilyticus]
MSSDDKDKRQARTTLIALVVVLALVVAAVALMIPLVAESADGLFSAGMGLKDAAVVAFFVTIALLVVFAISSGDGLIGELQYVLGGFFTFFVVIWLMIAWIF